MSRADRVFVHFGNTPEFFVNLLAIWGIGGCVIPIDNQLTPFQVETLATWATPRFSLWLNEPEKETEGRLAHLGVRTLADVGDDHPIVSMSPEFSAALQAEDNALILFTSGTTGQPKGVVHTHRSLRAQWMNLRECLGLTAFRRTLCLLPTHFGHGLICNSLFPWLFGQDLYVVPPFRPDVLGQLGGLLDEHQITFMSSVPAVWKLTLKVAKPPRTRSLRRVICGSAPLSATLWRAVQEWTGTHEVLNAYGITETASWLAGTTVPHFRVEDGLIGVPWGTEIKITTRTDAGAPPQPTNDCSPNEPGYVWVKSPALMRSYLGRDDLTAQVVKQGWFFTGDIGAFDDRRLLRLIAREREEINRGGLKVYPGDVDAVVEGFAHTMDVCTFGYADALHGENVAVAVVLQSADEDTLRRLQNWTRQRLAKHQMPQRWYLLEEIPRSSRGKVNRAAVAEHCATRSPVDAHSLS
jgi:long-chain acyl-CoA synthetase